MVVSRGLARVVHPIPFYSIFRRGKIFVFAVSFNYASFQEINVCKYPYLTSNVRVINQYHLFVL